MSDHWPTKGWRLPWQGEQVPHALLDITRRCNISCRSCYNTDDGRDKTVDEVKKEIAQLTVKRKLHSISIVGGEPTLHPNLYDIVSHVRGSGLHAELFTNGVLINDETAARLRTAGLDLVFIHIQAEQKRSDLIEGAPGEAVEKLLDEKIEVLRRHGIDAGISVTAYPDRPDDLMSAIDYCIRTPHLSYMLVTLHRDTAGLCEIEGDINSGMQCCDAKTSNAAKTESINMSVLVNEVGRAKGLLPFCYLGSNIDPFDPRWVSFMLISAYDQGKLTESLSLSVSAAEKLYMYLVRALKGRFPFYTKPHQGTLKLQLILNSLFGGRYSSNLAFSRRASWRKCTLKAKRILFQSLATVTDSGRVVHCADCPDAVLKNGRLVPVCIADRVGC